MIHRYATAVWKGGLKEGTGTVSTESGTLKNAPYSFARRFGEGGDSNPEELLAASHAGCFAMAFSMALGEAGHVPERLETRSTVSMGKGPEGGFEIAEIALEVKAVIPGIEEHLFQRLATEAKENCLISRVLDVKIGLTARLEV